MLKDDISDAICRVRSLHLVSAKGNPKFAESRRTFHQSSVKVSNMF